MGRTRAEQVEQPEVEDMEAEAVAQRDRSRGEAVLADAAGPQASGVRVARLALAAAAVPVAARAER